jgi:DNA mismatch endonuclease, patch repair protein
MSDKTRVPRYEAFRPASSRAAAAARGSSRKRDTRCELLLRRAVWRKGLRYRVAPGGLAGRPDLVFVRARVAVFCDGDFWHGRGLDARLAKLARGHNAPYWTAKIRANVERDRRHDAQLAREGWLVLRFWERDIREDPEHCACQIEAAVRHLHAGTAEPPELTHDPSSAAPLPLLPGNLDNH